MNNDPAVKILETERLMVRKFSPTDASALVSILGDSDVMAHTMRDPLTFEEIKQLLEKHIIPSYAQRGWGRFAVVKKDDNILIGYAGFSVQKLDVQEYVDLGYGFAKQYWHKGYATEVARALVHYSKDVLHLPAIIALVKKENARSIQVAKKAGFTFCKECDYHGALVSMYCLEFKK